MILLVQNRDEQKGSVANWASLEGMNEGLRALRRVLRACCVLYASRAWYVRGVALARTRLVCFLI